MEQDHIGNASTILLSLKAPLSNLRSHGKLLEFAKILAKKLGLHVEGWNNCIYNRYLDIPGYTIILYLSESHLIIETYPEHNLFELEIATCRRINADQVKEALDKMECSDNIISIKEIQKYRHKWY